MSDAPPAKSRTRWGCLTCSTLGVLGLLCSGSLGIMAGTQAAMELATGWIAFASAVIPAIRPDPNEAVATAVAFTLLVAGGHGFLRWLHAARAGGKPDRPWAFRWTLSLAVAVVLMFAASLSWGGLVHNTGWLFTQERLLENNWESVRFDAGHICDVAQRVREDGGGAAELRRELRSGTMTFRQRDADERYFVAFVQGSDGRLARAVVFPRDEERLRKEGVVDCDPRLDRAEARQSAHREAADVDLDALLRSLR